MYNNIFRYISLFILQLRIYYEKYHTVEKISVSLVICNYLPLCEADFPYQEQSERAKPIMLSL